MRTGLTILLIALAVGCQATPRPAAGLASLLVHVQAEPKIGAQPPPEKVQVFDTPAPKDYGAFAKIDYSDLGQIVIWVEPVKAPKAPAPSGRVAVDIDPAKPASGVFGVASVGQQLVLRNVSGSPQTIYSVSDGNDFDFESVSAGGIVEYTVRSQGLIEVLTNSHDANGVQIYAAPSAWVRMARSGESVQFDNLPPGTYRIVSWHPRLPGSQDTVTLTPDHVTDASIDVTVNSLPKVGG